MHAELVRALREEYEAVDRIAAGLTTADLARATPCADWQVADLLFHMSRDARRACIALASGPPGPPTTDAVRYWTTLSPRPGRDVAAQRQASSDVVTVWLALSEVAVEAAEAAPPRLVARQGQVLTTSDFLATLVTEVTVHGLDLAQALDRAPWLSVGAISVATATLAGLLGELPPPWDPLTFIRKGTGRLPLTPQDREALGAAAKRFPLLS
jgi:uncharacterized protein (TIGR03083 family)